MLFRFSRFKESLRDWYTGKCRILSSPFLLSLFINVSTQARERMNQKYGPTSTHSSQTKWPAISGHTIHFSLSGQCAQHLRTGLKTKKIHLTGCKSRGSLPPPNTFSWVDRICSSMLSAPKIWMKVTFDAGNRALCMKGTQPFCWTDGGFGEGGLRRRQGILVDLGASGKMSRRGRRV